MAAKTAHQLLLLADHLKLSLLERQRAIALNLDPSKQNEELSRSLQDLEQGITQLAASQQDLGQAEESNSELAKLRRQYEELHARFHGKPPPPAAASTLTRPNDPSLASTFDAARSVHRTASKNVRFRDDPSAGAEEEDAQTAANRAALLAEGEGRYRDNPDEVAVPDQSQLDNQQIHDYHKQVLREQDEQLDVLGGSVRRQRMLGIQMGNELDDQNAMLDDVEGGVDRHAGTLERARRNLGNVARKSKDNWSWVTIGVLLVILVLLLIVLK